jgi:hypothetical protein
MSTTGTNGGGIEYRYQHIEGQQQVLFRDITAMRAAVENQNNAISEIRELAHKLYAKIDQIEGLLLHIKDALFPPEPPKKKRRKKK